MHKKPRRAPSSVRKRHAHEHNNKYAVSVCVCACAMPWAHLFHSLSHSIRADRVVFVLLLLHKHHLKPIIPASRTAPTALTCYSATRAHAHDMYPIQWPQRVMMPAKRKCEVKHFTTEIIVEHARLTSTPNAPASSSDTHTFSGHCGSVFPSFQQHIDRYNLYTIFGV